MTDQQPTADSELDKKLERTKAALKTGRYPIVISVIASAPEPIDADKALQLIVEWYANRPKQSFQVYIKRGAVVGTLVYLTRIGTFEKTDDGKYGIAPWLKDRLPQLLASVSKRL